jgi:hypothetical protein
MYVHTHDQIFMVNYLVVVLHVLEYLHRGAKNNGPLKNDVDWVILL